MLTATYWSQDQQRIFFKEMLVLICDRPASMDQTGISFASVALHALTEDWLGCRDIDDPFAPIVEEIW